MGAWRWLASAFVLVAVAACSSPNVDDDLSPADVRERVGLDALVVGAALRVAGLPVDEARGAFERCDEAGTVQYVATVTAPLAGAAPSTAGVTATEALQTEGWTPDADGGLLRGATRVTLSTDDGTLVARLTDTCVRGDMTTDVDELGVDDRIDLG